MATGSDTHSIVQDQLRNSPETLRAQLLTDPVQREIWGVSPGNLNVIFAERAELFRQLLPLLGQLCREEHIEGTLERELWEIYLPFAQWIIRRSSLVQQQRRGAFVLGINGAQGSGKTTINHILQLILRAGFNKKVVGFSIDDLYDTYERRLEKGKEISPILARIRGPGTHDLDLGIDILDRLIEGETTRIPRFDKSLANNQGDRVPESGWLEVTEAQDIVLFEGWNVGEAPFPENELDRRFEKLCHAVGFRQWRDYYVAKLKDTEAGYAALFNRLDNLVMIRIRDFSDVYANREQAEAKLRQRIADDEKAGKSTAGISAMSQEEVRTFVDHYEPWTLHMLQEMPARADLVLWMGAAHRIMRITVNSASQRR
jgi:D-glycerate 3-kinase